MLYTRVTTQYFLYALQRRPNSSTLLRSSSLVRKCFLSNSVLALCQPTLESYEIEPLSSVATDIMVKPNLPLRLCNNELADDSDSSNQLGLLLNLSKKVNDAAEQREAAYNTGRRMKIALFPIRDKIGTKEAAADLQAFLTNFQDSIPAQATRSATGRAANHSEIVIETVQLVAFQHFLEKGTLIPPVPWTTDEEYISGALMGLAQALQKYGLGRATVRDVESVEAACQLVQAILNFLLQIDFRNGPLRRKYDGTKYSLKALSTLLYELAVTAPIPTTTNESMISEKDDPSNKFESAAISDEYLLPLAELQALQGRMDHRDELRENLIKKCRDGQKAAKQAIYALHRGDSNQAQMLLGQCRDCIRDELLPIVEEEPPLRTGSFANVLEEYVEAKLFQVWLHGLDEARTIADDTTPSTTTPNCTMLTPEFFANDILNLEPDEYIGGLCDLTGEIGRFAVQRGTARDVDSVQLCLHANSNIQRALEMMERTPGKKIEAVQRSVEKLERMLYELSLSAAAGGRNVITHVETTQGDGVGDDDDR